MDVSGVLLFVWFVVVVLFWGGVVALMFLAIRWLVRQGNGARTPRPPGDDTALDLLRQRYARGEIDATEYEERRRVLGS